MPGSSGPVLEEGGHGHTEPPGTSVNSDLMPNSPQCSWLFLFPSGQSAEQTAVSLFGEELGQTAWYILAMVLKAPSSWGPGHLVHQWVQDLKTGSGQGIELINMIFFSFGKLSSAS